MWMRKPLTIIIAMILAVTLLLVPVSLAQNKTSSSNEATHSGVPVGSQIASKAAVRDVTNFTPSGPGDIIVKFKPGISITSEAASAINKQVNATVVRASQVISGMQTVKLAAGVSVDDAIAQYKSNPAVEGAWPNNKYTLDKTPTDTYYATNQWGLENTGQTVLGVTGTADADVDAAEAWDMTTGSSSVIVAVADTGVYQHPDLNANLGSGWDFLGNNSDYSPYLWYEAGHGTHVAGIIGAVGNNSLGVAGENWHVTIMPLQIFYWDGTTGDQITSSDMIIDAIVWAEAHGASIINLSLGGYGAPDSLLNATIAASSMLFACAAGNNANNNDVTHYYPSDYALPNIVSVAASDQHDDLVTVGEQGWGSNYGATSVDLAAPGYNVLSTFFWGDLNGWYYGYDFLGGTSMATPYVAGVAALTKALHPDYGYAALKSAILSNTDAKPAFTGKMVTGGRLNADKAVSGAPVGTWGPWASLGGNILAGTSPAACSPASGQTDWFVVGTNHQLYYTSNGGSSWTNLGGSLTSSPAAVSPSAGVIDVFARGTTGALYQKHYSGSTWGAWTNLGGQIPAGTSPAACSWGASREGLFVQGTNGALYQNTWTGTWSGWTSLGGSITSSPAATSPTSGVMDVFARGTTGALYQKHYSGGTWGAWTNLGGQIPAGTSPAACSWGASREDVFVQGTNGALYQNTWNGSGWSGWTSLGGKITSSPAAVSPATGTIDVGVRGTTGALYERIYTGG
jgi:subtilisin family serine protease